MWEVFWRSQFPHSWGEGREPGRLPLAGQPRLPGEGWGAQVQLRRLPHQLQTRPHRRPLRHRAQRRLHIVSSYSDWSNVPHNHVSVRQSDWASTICPRTGTATRTTGARTRSKWGRLKLFKASELSLQDFTPANVVWHPDYNSPSRLQNDIAIVTLDREVTINGHSSQPLLVFTDISSTDYVSHVCLPFPERLNNSLYSPDNSPDRWPEVN